MMLENCAGVTIAFVGLAYVVTVVIGVALCIVQYKGRTSDSARLVILVVSLLGTFAMLGPVVG